MNEELAYSIHLGSDKNKTAKAKEIAKTLNAEYLRLFVVDINIPAIQLYTKKEFIKVNGVYNEIFDDGFVLHEHGYEIKL